MVGLPLPRGAGEASHRKVHLIRALEGAHDVTLQGLQRRGSSRPDFQSEESTETGECCHDEQLHPGKGKSASNTGVQAEIPWGWEGPVSFDICAVI